jgi:hypothetical protein
MSINEIAGSSPLGGTWGPKKSERKDEPRRRTSDTAEVSNEAKVLAQRSKEVEQKVDTNFYDRREVLEDVADKILKALTSK